MTKDVFDNLKNELKERRELGIRLLKAIKLDDFDKRNREFDGVVADPHYEETNEENYAKKVDLLYDETDKWPLYKAMSIVYPQLAYENGGEPPKMLSAFEDDEDAMIELVCFAYPEMISFFSPESRKALFESGDLTWAVCENVSNADPWTILGERLKCYSEVEESAVWFDDYGAMAAILEETIRSEGTTGEYIFDIDDFYDMLSDRLKKDPKFLVCAARGALLSCKNIDQKFLYNLLVSEGKKYGIECELLKSNMSFEEYMEMISEIPRGEFDDMDEGLWKIVSPFIEPEERDPRLDWVSDLADGLREVYLLQQKNEELTTVETEEAKIDRAEELVDRLEGAPTQEFEE